VIAGASSCDFSCDGDQSKAHAAMAIAATTAAANSASAAATASIQGPTSVTCCSGAGNASQVGEGGGICSGADNVSQVGEHGGISVR